MNKEFLIIGNLNAITYKEVFPFIKNNKIWLGNSFPKKFYTQNNKVKIFGNIQYFTNINYENMNKKLLFTKSYNEKDYPKYDNYNAINVDKTKDIPGDYKGVMGVPISFIDKYNPEQFEIIGCCEPAINIDTLRKNLKFKEYKSRQVMINNILCQKTYHRLLIKRKDI